LCYAIRSSDEHSPEGTLAIEEEVVGPGGDSNIAAPITSLCAPVAHVHTMQFALGAAGRSRGAVATFCDARAEVRLEDYVTTLNIEA